MRSLLVRDNVRLTEKEIIEALESCKELFSYLNHGTNGGNIRIMASNSVHHKSLQSLFKDSQKRVFRIMDKIEYLKSVKKVS
jgi:hypothetical protein